MNREEYYEQVREKYHMSEEKRNFIIIGSPNHGNLGDIAITWASLNILQSLYPQDNVFDINMTDFPFDIDAIYHLIKKQDIIILQGGGNLGNVYLDDEMIRRYVISRFLNNRIIIFPQTINFTDDEEGIRELNISSRIYSKHKALFLCARDSKSNKKAENLLHVQSVTVPDVVFTQKYNMDIERNNVLLCFRNDGESNLDDSLKRKINSIIVNHNYNVKITDTVIEFDGNSKERKDKLYSKLNEFCSAKFVVTDRLHGLIFSIITNTPCVIIPTKGTKITSVVNDIANKDGIYLVEKIEDVEDKIEQACKCGKLDYNNILIEKTFQQMLERNLTGLVEKNLCNKDLNLAAYWNYKAYEANYWKNKISEEYCKEESNNALKNEELKVYSEWVENFKIQAMETCNTIEEQKAQIHSQEKKIKDFNQRIIEIESANKNEIKKYGVLQKEYAKQEKELIYKTQECEKLLKKIKETRIELVKLQDERNLLQQQLQQAREINSENEIKLINEKKQVQIQLDELYNNVKLEKKENSYLEKEIEILKEEKSKILGILDEQSTQIEIDRNERSVLEKTFRCLRIYGLKHTITSIMKNIFV